MAPPADLTSKLHRVRYSIVSTGLRRGLADLATLLLAYRPERDESFDKAFATDTSGSVSPANLGIADPEARQNAILYLPSPTRVTRWMLDHIGIDHRDFAFIDLGCGKGRVLLVASDYPFQQIIGVEISTELSEIARVNVARYQPTSRRCNSIAVRNVDATKVDYPDANLLLHLYHPFEPTVTQAVLSRLEAWHQASPRHIVIAYLLYDSAAESVQEVFSNFPWLHQTRYEQSVLGHYNWLFYST